MMRPITLLPALLWLLIGDACAEVSMPAFFSDHAVLQRDKPLPIWGSAAPGEAIEVSLGGQKATAVTGADGRWKVSLAAQPVSRVALVLTVNGGNTLTRSDILLGDVWLCSGQSNMSMPMSGFSTIPEYADDLKAAEQPLIRQFGAKDTSALEEQSDIAGAWAVSSAKSVGAFSAVGYHFARAVLAQTGVPIGIIRAAKGSTNIEAWLSREAILAAPGMKPLAEKLAAAFAEWEKAKKGGAAGGQANGPPHPLSEAGTVRPRCATRFNAMIAPFVGMALRGIVWYQAEHNALNPQLTAEYPAAQRALVDSWRASFADAALPFLYVQLPNYGKVSDDPGTHMAVTIDIGQADDIHPSNKYDVGERLGALALHFVYGKDAVLCDGPMYRAVVVKEGKAIVSFTGLGGGLIVGLKHGRGPALPQVDGVLQRFAIAGQDRKWVWADAHIDGDDVVVSSPKVPVPVAVRYAFSANPAGANLYNRAGFPAAPFRTDTW